MNKRRKKKPTMKLTRAGVKSLAKQSLKTARKINVPQHTVVERVPEYGFPIRIVKDKTKGITQITLDDKRWYTKDAGTELLIVPGTTYVVDATLTKGKGFENWLLGSSFEEAARKLTTAGDRGSRVHAAISHLITHGELDYGEVYTFLEGVPFTAREYFCIERFRDVWQMFRPIAVSVETPFVSETRGYGGTIDLVAAVDSKLLETYNPHKKDYGLEVGGPAAITVFDWTVSPDIRDGKKIQAHAYAKEVNAEWVVCVSLDSSNKDGFKVWVSKTNDPAEDWYGVFDSLLKVFNFFNGAKMPDVIKIREHIALAD